MWVNLAELNGLPGVDDDGNGYVDDIYGLTPFSQTVIHGRSWSWNPRGWHHCCPGRQ